MSATEELERWLSSKTGIEFTRGGVHRTLSDVVERRCKELGCSREEYLCRVQQLSSSEFDLLANAVTVVYTWFFRDPGQLSGVEALLGQWQEQRPMRVWIPGCATGEDAYSVALIAEALGVPVSILGTDLNSGALAAAEAGHYSAQDLRNLEPQQRRHFNALPNGRFAIAPALKKRVSFRRHNLVDPVPQLDTGLSWDLILCRNVFIYFEAEKALDVFARMTRSLTTGGHLLLGASEIVYDVPPHMEVVQLAQRLVLRRIRSMAPARRASTPPAARAPLPRPAPVRLLAPSLPPSSDQRAQRKATSTGTASLLERGHAMLEQSRISEAVALYDQAVANEPTNAEALMYRGIARYVAGEVESASRDLRAGLFLDPKQWLGTFYLALSYESMGLADDALREFRHLVRLDRDGAHHAPHALWAGWANDIRQLARRRLERAGLAAPGRDLPI